MSTDAYEAFAPVSAEIEKSRERHLVLDPQSDEHVVLNSLNKVRINNPKDCSVRPLRSDNAGNVVDKLCVELQAIADSKKPLTSKDMDIILLAERVRDKLQGHLHRAPKTRVMARYLERIINSVLSSRKKELAKQDLKVPPVNLRSKQNQAKMNRWKKSGLDPYIFHRFPDFSNSILDTFLHRFLSFFGHSITSDKNDSPRLLVNGERVPWNILKERFSFENGKVASKHDGKIWSYFEEGLVEHDPVNWTQLRPFEVLPKEQRPQTPILQVVSVDKGSLHAWVRVVKTTGEVYSTGLFLQDGFQGFSTAGSGQKGKIRCPDLGELDRKNQVVVDLPIDDKLLNDILKRIESYQNLGVHFNFADQNCNVFVAGLADMAGQNIRMKRGLMGLVLPGFLRRAGMATFPKSCRKATGSTLDAIGMFGPNEVINTVALLLGAHKGLGPDRVGALIKTPTDFVVRSQIRVEWPGGLRSWQRDKLRSASDGAQRL